MIITEYTVERERKDVNNWDEANRYRGLANIIQLRVIGVSKIEALIKVRKNMFKNIWYNSPQWGKILIVPRKTTSFSRKSDTESSPWRHSAFTTLHGWPLWSLLILVQVSPSKRVLPGPSNPRASPVWFYINQSSFCLLHHTFTIWKNLCKTWL